MAQLSTGHVLGPALVGCVTIWLTGVGGDSFAAWALRATAAIVIATVGAAALRASREPMVEVRTRQAWRRIGLAFAAPLLGTAIGAVEAVVVPDEPFPSTADVANLAFAPLVLWAVMPWLGAPRAGNRAALVLDTLMVAVGAVMVSRFGLLGGSVDAGATWVALHATAYPVGDIVVLFLLGLLVACPPNDVSARALRLLAGGLAVTTVAHAGIALESARGDLSGSSWPHLVLLGGWGLVAFAADVERNRARARTFDAYCDRSTVPFLVEAIPHAAAGVAGVLLIGLAVRAGSGSEAAIIVGSLALAAFAHVRLGLPSKESAALDGGRIHIDKTTGLPNRQSFLDAAATAMEMTRLRELPASLIVVDIDGLRHLNAALGDAAGDSILREVATRCQRALRGSDLVARYGGDEIVAFLLGTDAAGTAAVMARLRADLSAPVDIGGCQLDVSVTVVAVTPGRDTSSIADLLVAADESLEQAKLASTPRPVRVRPVRAITIEDSVPVEPAADFVQT